jgi:hypothetical protein
MNEPILLYSTNTWLAYNIAQQYYHHVHYVWCTPYLGPGSQSMFDSTVPPSSSPLEVYRSLHEEVQRGDDHSSKILDNKAGLLKGANFKHQSGAITDQEERDIAAIVDRAVHRDFRPLLYVIPYGLVAGLISEVPVAKRAHPLSREYVIAELPRSSFDIIDFYH